MKKTYLILSLAVLILSLAVVSAIVSESNYVYQGTIHEDGSESHSSTAVNNVNVIGFICTNIQCNNVSGTLWDSAVLNTGSSNYINLVYPTTLLGAGYGVYIYKPNYILYEVFADWAGNGNVGPFSDYLYKKEGCTSEISNFQADTNNLTVGETLTLNANIASWKENAGPLNYIPPQLAEYYKTNTTAKLEVNKGTQTINQQEKELSINFSSQKKVEFSWTPMSSGTYTMILTTEISDERCSSSHTRTAELTGIIVNPECTQDSDCANDSYSNNYCIGNDVWKNYTDVFCGGDFCDSNTTPQKISTCQYGCDNGTCNPQPPVCTIDSRCGADHYENNYCIGSQVWRNFIDNYCSSNSCLFNITPEYVNNCTYGCTDGTCNPEPPICTQDSDCANDSYSNNYCIGSQVWRNFIDNYCSSNTCAFDSTPEYVGNCTYGCTDGTCNPEPPICTQDSDCALDYYSSNYCSGNDVYRNLFDNYCGAGLLCQVNMTPELVEHCSYGCANGVCKNNNGGGSSSRNIGFRNVTEEEPAAKKIILEIVDDNATFINLGNLSPKKLSVIDWLFWPFLLLLILLIILAIIVVRKFL